MEFRKRILDIPANIVVLHVSGRITSEYLPELEKELKPFYDGPPVKLILDLQHVDAIDSQGVGVLIHARNKIVGNEGKVALIGLHDRTATVLKISGLEDYFLIAPTEFKAIKMLE